MNIKPITITIRELIEGYEEKGKEGIEGVVAYGGKLNVRPAYQREFVYDPKERDEVIRSVKKKFPINVMYWAKTGEGQYEVMDGQQRTVSICRYAAAKDPQCLMPYERCFTVDNLYFFNLQTDAQDEILDYVLNVYVCDGTPSEVLDWFKVINIAGKILLPQELRNVSFTGPWLSDAKLYFSKPDCVAYKIGKDYVSGSSKRQEYLERAIEWISARDGLDSIEQYMALHQWDENASTLKLYFKRVIDWVKDIFPNYRKEMKGIDWGLLYNEYKDKELDPVELETQIKKLMMDDDVTNKKGIYTYILTGEEKFLNIRQFTESQRRTAFERQNGVCPDCGKTFSFEEMHGDHITPWSKGGQTIPSNCKMRCAKCNRFKSDM